MVKLEAIFMQKHLQPIITKLYIICDHYPLSPRVNKLIETIEKEFSNIEALTWNRTNKVVSEPFIYAYQPIQDMARNYASCMVRLGF